MSSPAAGRLTPWQPPIPSGYNPSGCEKCRRCKKSLVQESLLAPHWRVGKGMEPQVHFLKGPIMLQNTATVRSELAIPPLISGGIILTYRCTNTCRHCLYRCSPQRPDEWITLDMTERVFNALAREPRLESIHLAGGEGILHMDVLVPVIHLALDKELPLGYVETNAAWCTNEKVTREKLQQLKDAGLPALLVSTSMFHNEFVPFQRTRLCVELAREIFGERHVIVWLPELYELISHMPDDGTHSLEDFCRWAGLEHRPEVLPRMYALVAGGRVLDRLRLCYQARPAEAYEGFDCQQDLLNTTHFHIDLHGHLFTGLCPGIVAAEVPDLHPLMAADIHPIFNLLCQQGPWGLMRMAQDRFGYQCRPDGYIGKCDLCTHVRTQLHATGLFSELQPDDFYDDVRKQNPPVA